MDELTIHANTNACMHILSPSVYLCVCLSACLSVCLSISLSLRLSVCLSLCPSVRPLTAFDCPSFGNKRDETRLSKHPSPDKTSHRPYFINLLDIIYSLVIFRMRYTLILTCNI